jgi:sulfate permease, SulP family
LSDSRSIAPPNRAPVWPLFRSLAGYRPSFVGPDLIAGLTLAAIVIPEQMATARLGGLPPQAGFFAFIAAAAAFWVFGANRFMSVGADSTIAPIFAGGLLLLASGGSGAYMAEAAALALMVGVFVLAAGITRMGWIADLLSTPVTVGFLAGIAVHIVASQAPAAMGVPAPGGSLPQQLAGLVVAAPRASLTALAIAGGVLALTTVAHLISPRIPGALVGMALATLAVQALGLEAYGVTVLGRIPAGLPPLAWPMLTMGQILTLAPLALLIALVVMVQTGATSRAFPSDPREPPDISSDYVGVGVANIAAGLFGGFPVDASPPRTGVVAESGGRSQIAGLAAVAVVVLLLLFGAGLLTDVPRAALSGVLLFVAARIVRVQEMRKVLAASPLEFLLIIATTGAIVILPIQSGAAVGIGLSLLYGMWSSVEPRSYELHRVPGSTVWWPTTPTHKGETLGGVNVIGFQAPLTFINADTFRRVMFDHVDRAAGALKLLVLEATGIIDIDYTGAQAFKAVVEHCHEAGAAFAVARLEAVDAHHALRTLGLRDLVGDDHIFPSVEEAVDTLAPDATAVPQT